MHNDSPIYLSVIIPAYNEAHRLPATLDDVLRYLKEQTYTWEVLVADDGSTDATVQLVENRLRDDLPLRVIHHPDKKNHGKGASVLLGMLAAKGDYRLFMDADNSTTIQHVEQFWPYFDEGYDVVIGSRGLKNSVTPVQQSWYRELAGEGGNLFIRLLAVPGLYDTQAGFKMVTAQSAEAIFRRITIERWGFDVEMLAIARHLGQRIKEAPITWVNDPHGKVTFGTYLEVLKEVWLVRRNLRSGLYD